MGAEIHFLGAEIHNLVGYPVTPRGGIMNVTVAQPGFEPGSRGHEPRMLPLHYSAILQGTLCSVSVPKTDAFYDLLSVPFSINIIAKFSKKVKFNLVGTTGIEPAWS